MNNYNFPVSIQDIFTKQGAMVPRIKAVVREDTGEALAPVSKRYRLVPHSTVVEAAEAFVTQLGEPERKFTINNNGSVMLAEYTYKDRTLAVNKDDIVGMRVFMQNSYTAKQSLQYRVGALVLSCLNGMISTRKVFELSYRHVGTSEIILPEPESVLANFTTETQKWQSFNTIVLDKTHYDEMEEQAINESIVPEKVRASRKVESGTVWDLYQQFTYHITHAERVGSSPIGKLSRLDRVARWMDKCFA